TSVLKNRIAAWLSVTRDLDVFLGLDEKEADQRARDLLRAILERQISPESVVLDEETKQVLSVLVRQLAKSGADPEERLHDADAVYQFIRRLPWPEDLLGEQQDLLLECAEIGWGAIGLSVAEVTRRRSEGLATIHDFRTDPIHAPISE